MITTPANVNDTTPADDLVRGDEKAVWGDAAYHTHARQAALKARGVKARLMRRANKHHALPDRLKRYNRLISRRRAQVETTFATLKQRMGLTRIRYVGLAKASAQVLIAAMARASRSWSRPSPRSLRSDSRRWVVDGRPVCAGSGGEQSYWRQRSNRSRRPIETPLAANQGWSLDFVSDQMTDGRRFRIPTVIDNCTRERLGVVVDTSLSGRRVARELDASSASANARTPSSATAARNTRPTPS